MSRYTISLGDEAIDFLEEIRGGIRPGNPVANAIRASIEGGYPDTYSAIVYLPECEGGRKSYLLFCANHPVTRGPVALLKTTDAVYEGMAGQASLLHCRDDKGGMQLFKFMDSYLFSIDRVREVLARSGFDLHAPEEKMLSFDVMRFYKRMDAVIVGLWAYREGGYESEFNGTYLLFRGGGCDHLSKYLLFQKEITKVVKAKGYQPSRKDGSDVAILGGL